MGTQDNSFVPEMLVGRPDLLQEGITNWYKYLQEKTHSGNRAEKGKQVLADGTLR